MELNWSTFVLEIVNFLVLVWILKHFLYRPVLDVIARRRQGIEKTLADAEARRVDAEDLKSRYEGRLADWNRERQQARDALAEELEAEHGRRLHALQDALAQETEKTREAEARRLADESRRLEAKALRLGADFAARLLREGAGPETEERLIELALAEILEMPEDRLALLRGDCEQDISAAVVTSAYALADEQRTRIARAVSAIASLKTPIRFAQDADLLAGLRIAIGDWVLGFNLVDELRGFAAIANGDLELG